MNLTLNGQPVVLDAGATVADAVRALTGQDAPRGVAVARAGTVVPRTEWPHTVLVDGDRLEVLTATQGG
jgi:sulfur carrier protein